MLVMGAQSEGEWRPLAEAARGVPLLDGSENDNYCHKDHNALCSPNTEGSIFKGRVQKKNIESMRTPFVPLRLPRAFIETNKHLQALPFLGRKGAEERERKGLE